MFSALSALPDTIQNEVAELAERYRQPVVKVVNLEINKLFDPLSKTDRYGEVCMVVRRPNGRLLTMTKTYYPTNAYRLLTGGVNHGEPVFDALLRETREETNLQVNVSRFLAIAAYTVNGSKTPIFYTFAFLLDETGGVLGTLDESERVEDFREIEPADLPVVAAQLEHVGDDYSDEIAGSWGDWGRFRAVIHHLVYEALQQ